MTIYRCYKFTSPEVLAASRQYTEECVALQDQAKALGREFGGVPVYSTTVHGRSFHGLRFAPPLDSPLWTKPDKQSGDTQRIRSSVKATLRDEHNALKARWEAAKPTAKPSIDSMFSACGTNWGDLLFSGIGYILTDEAVYLTTSADLTARGQEITGGEYQAADGAKSLAA